MSLKNFSLILIILFLGVSFFTSFSFAQEMPEPLVCADPYLDLINSKIELTQQSQAILELKMFLALNCVDMPEKLKKLDLDKFYQDRFLRQHELKYDMKLLADVHRMLHGNIDKIKDKNFKEVYWAIKNNDTTGLKGWYKDLAQGIIQEDRELVKKAINSRMDKNLKLKEDIPGKLAELVMVDLYIAKYGEAAAKKFTEKRIPAKYWVELVFAKNSQAIINRITRDLTLFDLVRICNEPELANRIQDEDIKEKSLDKSLQSIYDFWGKYP